MAAVAYRYDEPQESLLQQAVSAALKPVHFALSPTAIKAYLSTILFLTTSTILLSLSTIAYLFLYYSYIPQINLSHIIYLQYGSGPHPYAITPLDPSALVSQQPYDISIHLHLPKTPTNLGAGNFMLDLSLLAAPADPILSTVTNLLPNATDPDPYTTIASSRRPAILPFSSPMLGLTSTFINLPWHLLSVRDLDSTHLDMPMFERVSFARGASAQNIPRAIRLELQSEHVLQVYSAKIEFVARFEGLRYILYNYRVICFLLFSSVFYTVAISTMATAWFVISSTISSADETKTKTQPRIKDEADQRSNGTTIQPLQLSTSQSATTGSSSRTRDQPQGPTAEGSSDSDQGLTLSSLSDPSPAVLPPALAANTSTTTGRKMPLRMPLRRRTPESSLGSSTTRVDPSSTSTSANAGPSTSESAPTFEATSGLSRGTRDDIPGVPSLSSPSMQPRQSSGIPTWNRQRMSGRGGAGDVGDDEDGRNAEEAGDEAATQDPKPSEDGTGSSVEDHSLHPRAPPAVKSEDKPGLRRIKPEHDDEHDAGVEDGNQKEEEEGEGGYATTSGTSATVVADETDYQEFKGTR